MLTYKTNVMCECCCTPNVARAYRWHTFRYCITCLHSIGVNAAGRACTDAQYVDAWRAISGHPPEVCGGTGNHDGQPIKSCDECDSAVVAA